MPKFEFDYDRENDSLFVFRKGAKSKSSIELGNLIYDFDDNDLLAGVEILSAADTLTGLVNHNVDEKLLLSIKSTEVETKTVGNLLMIRIKIGFNQEVLKKELIAPIQVPNIKTRSPALV